MRATVCPGLAVGLPRNYKTEFTIGPHRSLPPTCPHLPSRAMAGWASFTSPETSRIAVKPRFNCREWPIIIIEMPLMARQSGLDRCDNV